MSDAVYVFDVDDCLEVGGQIRLPSTFGPVTIQSIRQEAAPPDGDICGILGNWVNLPSLIPDWREFLRFLLPPVPSNSHKGFWLAWVRSQYPGYQHYVMIGNDPNGHDRRPAYWDQQWPGTLPVTHIPGDRLLSNDIGAAADAGFEFIKEDEWAAGRRIGTIPPPSPGRPVLQFPKQQRLSMEHKFFSIPGAVKSVNFDSGIIEAIVSVTANRDRQNDIIAPGAYEKVLKSGRLPKVVKQHHWDVWLGKTVDAEELKPGDPRLPEHLLSQGWGGVYVKGQFTMEDPAAKAVYAHLKNGVIDEFSVGFEVDKNEKSERAEEIDADTGVRTIKSIFPWYEWSPVLMGANPETVPLAIKEDRPPDQIEAELGMAFERIDWVLGITKSDLSTQAKRNAAKYKLRVNGKVKYPINDCSDVRDAWALRGRSSIPAARVASYVRRAAAKLGCKGPWNSGKSLDEEGVHALDTETAGDDDASSTNATIYVPETKLSDTDAIAIGAAAAAAFKARQRSQM